MPELAPVGARGSQEAGSQHNLGPTFIPIYVWFQVTALDDQPPPIIAIGPANQTLPVNTIAVLPCQASGNPKPDIRWLKGGRPLLGTADHTSRIMVEPSGTLVIDSKFYLL